MPTIVKEIPSEKKPIVSKYDYLFDGKIRLFTHKELSKRRLATVSVTAYMMGKKRGQKIHFVTRPEGVYVFADKRRGRKPNAVVEEGGNGI